MVSDMTLFIFDTIHPWLCALGTTFIVGRKIAKDTRAECKNLVKMTQIYSEKHKLSSTQVRRKIASIHRKHSSLE